VILAGLLLVSLSYIGLRPFWVRLLFTDRKPVAAMLSQAPHRLSPGYVELIRSWEAVIPEGSRVAVVLPRLEWDEGYSYAYFRAQYYLPGRRVIPLGWPTGARPEKLAEADWAIVVGPSTLEGDWVEVRQHNNVRLVRREP
jgi:hypothetical protein